MKARIQYGLLRVADPRIARIILFGLMLALAMLGHGSAVHADPCGATTGCGGG
jgi:hypothetical protein